MGSPGLGANSAVLMSLRLRFCLCVCVCVLSHFSCVRLFSTPWTVAHQAPLSLGFSRQYWSGLPYSFSRGVSQPRNRTHVSCIAGGFFTHWTTREAPGFCVRASEALPLSSNMNTDVGALHGFWGQCIELRDESSLLVTLNTGRER